MSKERKAKENRTETNSPGQEGRKRERERDEWVEWTQGWQSREITETNVP